MISTTATRTGASVRPRVPGDLLLSPVAVAAVLIVVINDRVLKVDHPSVVSGKLSDLAGLVYFPLFVVAAVEAVRRLRRRHRWQLTWSAVAVAAVATGLVFTTIKCWQPAADVYRPAVGLAMWPLQALASLAVGQGLPSVTPAPLVLDPTDLIALPMLIVPVLVARRVMRDAGQAQVESVDRSSARASVTKVR